MVHTMPDGTAHMDFMAFLTTTATAITAPIIEEPLPTTPGEEAT